MDKPTGRMVVASEIPDAAQLYRVTDVMRILSLSRSVHLRAAPLWPPAVCAPGPVPAHPGHRHRGVCRAAGA